MKWISLLFSIAGGLVFYVITENKKKLNNMRLTQNFELSEFLKTSTGFDNEPTPAEVRNIKLLTEKVLQPFRDEVGRLDVTSGFRSAAVNEAVGGVEGSDHRNGSAADVVPADMEIDEAFNVLRGLNLPIKQAIKENKNGVKWIHISLSFDPTPKQEFLTARFDPIDQKMKYKYV